ncbi:MAG: response regulator transcription factor [Chitinophagales bacterium]
MSPDKVKILIVDDEADVLEFMRYNLKKEGFQVFIAPDGIEAIKIAKKEIPHLVVLDIMMPEMDGLEACKELRTIPSLQDTLITFLTARSEEFTQVMGLEIGADDYITKPVKPRLLISKVKSLLRRYSKQETEDVLFVSDLEINRDTFTIKRGEQIIELPRKEFKLIYLLASKPGKVFTREKILREVWGTDVIVNDRTIDVHIRKLREKIGNEYIKTIKGIGYKFEV